MQLSDRARRALFGERFFLEKPAVMSAVVVDSAVHVECFGRKPSCLCRSCRRPGRPIGRIVSLFAANALNKPPLMRYACSMVAFVDGGLPFGSLVFNHQFLDLFV